MKILSMFDSSLDFSGIAWVLVLVIIVIVLLAAIVSNFKIVPQAHSYVLERLGVFHAAWGTGLHLKIPFIDRIAKKVSLKEQVIDFPPQPVITKDNVTMQIDTVVYFQITDLPGCYQLQNPGDSGRSHRRLGH